MSVKSILIVEDDLDIMSTVQTVLQTEGYATTLAQNGLIALELLNKADPLPDLIILDYMMPVMDGWTFRVEQLKNEKVAGIPVMLMTASPEIDIQHAGLRLRGLIKKPFTSIDAFIKTVNSCLKS